MTVLLSGLRLMGKGDRELMRSPSEEEQKCHFALQISETEQQDLVAIFIDPCKTPLRNPKRCLIA